MEVVKRLLQVLVEIRLEFFWFQRGAWEVGRQLEESIQILRELLLGRQKVEQVQMLVGVLSVLQLVVELLQALVVVLLGLRSVVEQLKELVEVLSEVQLLLQELVEVLSVPQLVVE